MDEGECLKQILILQKAVFESKEELREEISSVKDALIQRITPIEDEISKNKHTVSILTKALTWGLPSGFLVGLSAWIEKFWK